MGSSPWGPKALDTTKQLNNRMTALTAPAVVPRAVVPTVCLEDGP